MVGPYHRPHNMRAPGRYKRISGSKGSFQVSSSHKDTLKSAQGRVCTLRMGLCGKSECKSVSHSQEFSHTLGHNKARLRSLRSLFLFHSNSLSFWPLGKESKDLRGTGKDIGGKGSLRALNRFGRRIDLGSGPCTKTEKWSFGSNKAWVGPLRYKVDRHPDGIAVDKDEDSPAHGTFHTHLHTSVEES